MSFALERAARSLLLTVIAPVFVSGRVADLIALARTMVAAMRLPLLPTVLIGVVSARLARSMFGWLDSRKERSPQCNSHIVLIDAAVLSGSLANGAML